MTNSASFVPHNSLSTGNGCRHRHFQTHRVCYVTRRGHDSAAELVCWRRPGLAGPMHDDRQTIDRLSARCRPYYSNRLDDVPWAL